MILSNSLIRRLALGLTLATLSLQLTACSEGKSWKKLSGPTTPVVTNLQIQSGPAKPSVSAEAQLAANRFSETVSVTVTLDKTALFGTEWIYGADVQYSTQYDLDMDLYSQAYAVPHTVARFRISGDELQLLTDNRLNFPSDSNHPEKMISRFKILSQTDTTITVSGANSSLYLAQIFGPVPGSTTYSVADTWIRSFQFVPTGNYILQETSIVLPDGTIAEFMESVFPRANLEASLDFRVVKMDPDNAVGGQGGLFDRFRFLDTGLTFNGEERLSYAQHFDIGTKADGTPGTIDWYVTRNIPDEYLEPVRFGVEGWNRYFRNFTGIQRDVIRFMGRLPEGVKLGDPRFNVIAWDSRTVAGAAYESQASEPTTGKQSHSLIYLPAAWVQIGIEFWERAQVGQLDQEPPAQNNPTVTRNLIARRDKDCARKIQNGAAILASGRISEDELNDFGKELLKSTLFHEVGHALGMAHNFKGSLAWHRGNKSTMFTTSIMDYNNYELDRDAFYGLHTSDGPQLEYDRQFMSALYNHEKDIRSSDPVLPMCNDAEADAQEGGVDPLCIRYDLEHDPSLAPNTANKLMNEAQVEGEVTLAQALRRIPRMHLTSEAVQKIATREDLEAAVGKVTRGLTGTLAFYTYSGDISIGRSVRVPMKMLYQFADGVLPEGYDAREMRERIFAGVQRAVSFTALPAAAKAGLADAQDAAFERLAQSPFVQSMNKADADQILSALREKMSKATASFEKDAVNGIPRMRASVLAALARSEKVPFYFGREGDSQVDYETAVVGLLTDVVLAETGRASNERINAANSLATFRGRMQGDLAIQTALARLALQRTTATNNASRELVEKLLKALTI